MGFAYPAYATLKNSESFRKGERGSLSTDSEEALPVNAQKRGAYINSGSRDVGKDPNWKDGKYVRPKSQRRSWHEKEH